MFEHINQRTITGLFEGRGFSASDCKQSCLQNSLFKDDKFQSKVGKATRFCHRLMKVRVYRNLNKPEYYSILAMEGGDKGKVIGYARSILLENCQLIVSEKSRLRVIRDKRKNVHAFCQGNIRDASEVVQVLGKVESVITYNPYKMGTFFRRYDGAPFVDNCDQAILQGSDMYIKSL